MKQYRIRLKNERVIGPFLKKDIIELFKKSRINGTEEVQFFPTGDWKSFDEFPELADVLEITISQSDEATFIRKISLEDLKSENENLQQEAQTVTESIVKKFEYEKKTPFTEKEELEIEKNEEEIEPLDLELNSNVVTEADDKEEKTNELQNAQEDEKTLINTNTVEYLEELKKEKQRQEALDEEKEDIVEEEVDFNNDSTQMLSIDVLKDELQKSVIENEKSLIKEKKKYEKEAKKREKREKEIDKNNKEEDSWEEMEEPPKKKKIIVVVAFILIFYALLFLDEEEKGKIQKVTFSQPSISFPIRFDVEDKIKAKEYYQKGLRLEKEGTYQSFIKASKAYRLSTENQFNNNTAAAKLIFIYSILLKHSNEKEEDANTIFKLVQIFKSKILLEPAFAAAISAFYLSTNKANAAVKTIERYLTLKKGKPSVDMFGVYLKSLIKTGNIIVAKKAANKIESISLDKLSVYTVDALIEYYRTIGNFEKIAEIVEKSLQTYKNSISLHLTKASLFFYKEDFDSLEVLLKKIRTKQLGGSKVFYSKYLEYKGLIAIKNGKIEIGEKLFEKALKTHENLELRSRLASLYDEDLLEQNLMISQSRSLQLIASSKLQASKNNWKFAFKDALEATRIAENFIPAQLHLAKLQIKQSIFEEAIKTLKKLYKENSQNPEIIFALIDAYIESYKFTDVKKLLTLVNSSELRNRPEYSSLSAKFYIYKDDFKNSVAWLLRSINRNPLNDENRYLLAKVLIRYNKFNRAKSNLNKAMDLDPSKVEYRVAFSNILYETDSASTAIGYLYDVLTDFPDNAKILSQIGILYYRSGQIKSFENIKEKLSKLPTKDTTLYKFLIEAARLDDKQNEEVKYSKKLVELNPGDLKTRLNLGKIYMEQEKYKVALREFKAIESRLETYPKLQLYMSKLYLLTDNTEKAIELAMKEVKANSSSAQGYVLLGDIYSVKKEYLKAEKYYKKAQKINGDDVDMLLGLAKVNFKKSQYDLTIDLFLKARELAPERAEVHKLLGDVYRKTGQSTLGIESYKLFLELSPTSKYKDEIQTYIRKMQ